MKTSPKYEVVAIAATILVGCGTPKIPPFIGSGGNGGTGAGGTANAAGAPSGGGGSSGTGGATGGVSAGGSGGVSAAGSGGVSAGGSGGVSASGSGGVSAGGSGGVSAAGSGGVSAAGSGGVSAAGSGGASNGGGGTGGTSTCGDIQTSDPNCGACGFACVNGRHCSAGRCSPAWQALATDNQPAPRTSQAAGFVGGQYVVFGGSTVAGGAAIATTGKYDVATNQWQSAPPLNSARCAHSAVSTGTSIITFGGLTNCGNGTTTGPGFEVFANGTWTSVPGGPIVRYSLGSIWTGKEMFLYGGSTNVTPGLAAGSRFDPSGPSWIDVTCSLANCERVGSEMFVDSGVVHLWGGGQGDAPAGLQYDLTSGVWSSWTVPNGTASHISGTYADDGRRIYFVNAVNRVSVFDRTGSKWLADDTSATPAGFCGGGASAWTGAELIAWDSCGAAPVGGRYQPSAPN